MTVGNAHQPFARLVEGADAIAARCAEEVVVQAGHTPCKARHARIIPFLRLDEYDEYVARSRIVVSHAGSGSIIVALQHHKPLIVVPRRKKFGEHVNDHQLELSKAVADAGLGRVIDNIDELWNAVENPPPARAGGRVAVPPLVVALQTWFAEWMRSRS